MAKKTEEMIYRLFSDGMKVTFIAYALGLPRDYVQEAVNRQIKKAERKRKVKSTKLRNQKMRQEMKAGATVEELAEKYGLSEVSVKSYTTGVATEIMNERDAEIRKKRAEGMSADQLVKETGLSIQTIYRICEGITVDPTQIYEKYISDHYPVTPEDLSEKFGITYSYACRVLNQYQRKHNILVARGPVTVTTDPGKSVRLENAIVLSCKDPTLFSEALKEKKIFFGVQA